jgi:hypothetical protein
MNKLGEVIDLGEICMTVKNLDTTDPLWDKSIPEYVKFIDADGEYKGARISGLIESIKRTRAIHFAAYIFVNASDLYDVYITNMDDKILQIGTDIDRAVLVKSVTALVDKAYNSIKKK